MCGQAVFPLSSVSNTSSATAVTVPMAYNPEALELAQSWAAQTFDHPWTKSFHGSKRFTEIAASREQGTWGKKQGSCSNKDFLLPGACWQLTQPCLCQNWMVSGDILDRLCICFCPLCFQISLPGFIPLCPPGAQLTHQHKGRAPQDYKNGPWQVSWSNAG